MSADRWVLDGDKMEMLVAVQQASMALEELQGPGFLIGGVMHYRIGLILPELNAVIDALAAAPAAPAAESPEPQPLTDEQLWANDEIMSLNADLGWHMDTIRMFARAIERAHGIGAPHD
jgi:hypothetical protein